MDNSSSGLAERPTGGSGVANGPSLRRTPSSRPVSVNPQVDGGSGVTVQPHHIPAVTVIVYKDETGYGMKVSGDKPVYVQSVKEGGAAERAGLHSGDKIIKVNGVNVMQSTHTEVVGLIKSSTQVVLTVQQRPVHSQQRPTSTGMTSPSLHARPLHHHHSAPARATDRITSPLPVDHEKLRQLECQRVHTLRLMLEKEQRYVEALRSELAKSNEPKLHQELTGAERRVRTLQDQLVSLTMNAEHETASPQVSALHTHHRTKSSPDPLNMHNMSLAEASRRLIASESMSDLSCGPKRVTAGSTWDVDSPRVTPPGTPPPPYGGGSSILSEGPETVSHIEEDAATPDEHGGGDATSPEVSPLRTSCGSCTNTATMQQQPIISMEEDEMSDQEVGQLEDHGPFKSLSKLWEHNAHLAVFMNYVISNSDPSSLLFYLITDLYKEGNAKEMKKWAYEIHSSFLVPGAPLRLSNVDENVAREIDDVLLKDSEKEEFLRRIFFKARGKAKEELNEQLADFQQKRTAGLGTIFGPPEAQLDESIHDKNKEMKIVENILIPKMEGYLEDIERDIVDARRFTTAAALGTVMGKVFGLRSPHSNSLLDRCPTFVSKDKSLKAKLIGKTRKVTVRGHHFVAHQYYTVTYCNHCQLIIWGIGPQGYQCSDCALNIHRHCVRVVEENCPGPLTKKEKGNDRISKLMEKIRPEREARRKPSSHNFTQNGGFQVLPSMPSIGPMIVDRAKKQSEDECGGLTDNESGSGDRPAPGGRVGVERRPDPVRESEERPLHDGGPHNEEDDDYHQEITHPVSKKPSAASINRSESYKERVHQKRQLRERRKTSDPNLSKTNDVDLDTQGLSYNTNSGSSSNSSLSTRSLDSPSNSLEIVTAARAQEGVTVTPTPTNSAAEWDSDLEAEPDPVDWSKGVDEEVLKQLSARELKRQEVINELFHTERSHVRNLKVLDRVFYRPMLDTQILPPDHIQLLFSNLDEMLDIHSQFNSVMKTKRRDSPLVGDIADMLLSMFDGPAGENFQRAAATFCARQQIALELLRERRRKDAKLNGFLTDAEGNSLCRRLQLKDIIPTAMQRLTKYPLLFENLAKYTEEDTEELVSVLRAVERSREILNHVNQAVREAEDIQRLTEIQRRLDKSGFEKVEHPMAGEFKHLDLTKHQLIYEGSLNWRIGNRQKLIDLHVLLLDDVIILLQKQDEKYVLKFYNVNTVGGGGDRSPTLSPIIKVSTVLVRHNAVDEKALYLVNTSHNGAQIYDLVATSSSERKTWFRHISEAAEAYKTRDGKNRRTEPSGPSVSTPESEASENAQDKTKDSDETASEAVKEQGDLSVPPGGCSTTSQDVDSSPVSTSANENSPLPSNESTSSPQASPSSVPADGGETHARKMGDGLLSPSPGAQRRRVEPLRLTTEESPLIQPSEVVVSQRPVLTAEPVLTPIEQLRRKDEAIRLALADKQQLVADILHVPREEFENIAELAGEPSVDKEATELVLAAINQANQLTSVLNDTLRVTEEDAVSATSEVVPGSSARAGQKIERLPGVPSHKLQSISTALNTQLTQLLKIIKDRDEERERLRRELQRSREQLHVMHESHRRNQLNASPSPSHSRPNSLISQEGLCEPHHDSEDESGLHRSAETGHEIVDVSDVGTDKHLMSEQHDDTGPDVFVDALSGEAEGHLEAESELLTKTAEELEAVTSDSLAGETKIDDD
ncbi:rho guanine nucleotide exchange factor 12 isoform X5 [Cryptotermes secundus]|uniref:rho guanine nucleotide exchange factor 12 isoform X5 n=1 Tax=Cryptotermes secundus TaxID=105785 RepID=UPI000CD7CBA7|nr:rho guanine nucleotide exchange factor 12 isoform X5 [Cryptotermes secundus]